MMQSNVVKIRPTEASIAFQQLCNVAAISNIRNLSEILNELITHVIYRFDEESLRNADDIAGILETIFGVVVPKYQIQSALDCLSRDGRVQKPLGTNFVLSEESRVNTQARIDNAKNLQERIHGQWLVEITLKYSDLPNEAAWNALQEYLAKIFLRHGIQAVAFLDPSLELPEEYSKSLSAILDDVFKSHFDIKHGATAKEAISGFLSSTGSKPDRAQYVAECADGAFNFFSLMVSPEISSVYRDKLSPIEIFCDTNFLFGILDLHANSQVEISNHLLKVISDNNLPFSLYYHERTLTEATDTINYYGGELKKNTWSQSLSRAAITSSCISGIVLRYHQKNAESAIDADSFLQPYKHIDVLLSEKGINKYPNACNRPTEQATLQEKYIHYLQEINKDKPLGSINHDVTVLDCVRSIRDEAKTTLNAGALFLTCDYRLYRFDNTDCRRSGSYGSVVLPNVLWQILRPFVPTSTDYDKSFAETFAIPEFRTIGSGATKACSKMLSLLACYKNLSEEMAAKLLCNDILIDQLTYIENDEQFQEQVESAILAENQTLIEEHEALVNEISLLKEDKKRVEIDCDQQNQAATTEILKTRELLDAKTREAKEFSQDRDEERMRAHQASKKALLISKISGIINASLISAIFWIIIHNIWRWDWLLSHPNSYGLQGCFIFTLFGGIVGLWVRPWRKVLWGVGVLGIFFLILKLIGGPQVKAP